MNSPLYEFIENRSKVDTQTAGWFSEIAEEFRTLCVQDCGDLVSQYASLTSRGRFVAIASFLHFDFHECCDVVWSDLWDADIYLQTIAASAVGRFSTKEQLSKLIRMARSFVDCGKTELPLHLLVESFRNCTTEEMAPVIADLMVDVISFQGKGLDGHLRSRCIQTLAEIVRQLRRDEASHGRGSKVLIMALADPDAEVRASAIEAVAFCCQLSEAMEPLNVIIERDSSAVSGLGSLSDLAHEAVQFLETRGCEKN